ncbi:MAG: TlpA family protein disulfide reductase [Deltaproteobacteria bacterium]|nr:TlpA family protein disulfide reductase [Deltaproteobacteria bacterium]MBW1929773.1 TlpA family protein disulfide reductase [Deltaproteobacteria bacterium]MBW2024420.1 TlpA family protein disulfide reductase [Deltaproteobacteria bacterium]MBW2124521.1 TlpA family protein disulfide reductase [Deltaproteobacteria bacterium]RLB14775.1 MAG: hypothetical protein DRG63_07975 [Deltaproteobacteria bacterium]
MIKSSWKATVLIIVAVCLFAIGCHNDVGAGPQAPNFTLYDLNGQKVSLEEYKGSPVLLDFWATWCPPCRMSIPELIKIQEQYRDKGLVVLGLSLDDPSLVPDAYMKAFKEEFKINYRILRANERVMRDYFGYENAAIPTMFLVDRKGRIVGKIVGFQPHSLKKSLAQLLKE